MAQPARPYDALYDTTYTVSGARDHYRQQTIAGGFMLERAPEYPSMFSELPHFPSTTFRLKNSDKVPGFVDRNFHPHEQNPADVTMRSNDVMVTGQQRYKYFRRPLLAAPDPVIIKQAYMPPAPAPPPPVDEPRTKTIGTQSDYRENEVQTLPWDPDFKLPESTTVKQQHLSSKHHCDGPELLTIRDMRFGDGLPPGLQEVRRIEKLRAKREFEASLPPLNDLESLPLRQKMIEEWESKEWTEREEEILSVQDERLMLLEQAIQAREEEIDEDTLQRIENRKTRMLEERSTKFAAVQASRIKTMRQLIEARKYVEKPQKLQKQTIVEQYANHSSNMYAPVAREGRFPETKPGGKIIETEGFQPVTLQGLAELEQYLPGRLLNPKISAPQKPTKLDYAQRKDAAVQRDLKTINNLLDTAKSTKGRGFGECWPSPITDRNDTGAKTTRRSAIRAVDRPSTPELPAPAVGLREAAAVLLQRLLRGRAAQNVMYEGKTRRHELIQELRLEGSEEASKGRPETKDPAIMKMDALVGQVLSELVNVLADPNEKVRTQYLATLLDLTPLEREQKLSGLQISQQEATAALAGFGHSSSRAVTPAVVPGTPSSAAAAGSSAVADGLDGLGTSAEDAEAAAVRIQAAFKGHRARKEVAAMRARGAGLKEEVLAAAKEEAEGGKPDRQKPPPAPPRELEVFDGKDLERITKLQALQRGRIARREVQGMKAQPDAPADATPAPPGAAVAAAATGAVVDLEVTPDLEQKVIKIQALHRGRQARKDVAAMKGTPAPAVPAEEAGGQDQAAADQEAEQAAREAGINWDELDDQTKQKIIKLQALQRGRKARKQVAEMRKGTVQQLQQHAQDGITALSGAHIARLPSAYPEAEPHISAAATGPLPVEPGQQDASGSEGLQEQAQVEPPAEPPAEAPAEPPAEAPAEPPAEPPAEAPAEPPAQPPAEAPAEPPAHSADEILQEPSIGDVLAASPAPAEDDEDEDERLAAAGEPSLGHGLSHEAGAPEDLAPTEAATDDLNLAPPGAADQ